MVGRWLFRIFMLAVILGGVAWVVSLIFFSDPIPELEFDVKGDQVVDLEFSPDGTKLAVVTYELKPPDAAKLQATRIYQVSNGKPLHTLQLAAWRCNWNSDGSLLVTSAVNGKEFDIYDTATWHLKKHLTLTPQRKNADAASKDKKEEEPPSGSASQLQAVPGIVQALAFTRQGSLFTVTFAEDADSSYQLNHAKVWWESAALLGGSRVAGVVRRRVGHGSRQFGPGCDARPVL